MNPLQQLREHGQSFWLDNLTRHMLQSGELQALVQEGLGGITSNPTIFHKAISQSDDYDAQIRELAGEGRPIEEIYELLVVTDIRAACDMLHPVYDRTEGADGFVSLEVSPHLAHDTDASIVEARRLFDAVNRPNLLIKIPGTPAGVPAVEQLLFEGVNVNITLLFSIGAYEAVARAYLRGLERRVEAGLSVDRIASVASFFLSRIDTLVDQLLAQGSGTAASGAGPRDLLGHAAVANAKLAYQQFEKIRASDRWKALAERGARVQRMLWASTSTKNPAYRDVMYVEPLIGPDTVNTMPLETIVAFQDHGRAQETVEEGLDEARRVMDDLRSLGIDFPQVTDQLLREGVRKFVEPFDALLKAIMEKRDRLSGARRGGPLPERPGAPPRR